MITQAVTDAEGYFDLFNLEPGQYGVSFMIPMQLAAASSVEINTNYADVREGETTWIEVDFDSRYVNITRAEIEEAEPYPLKKRTHRDPGDSRLRRVSKRSLRHSLNPFGDKFLYCVVQGF